MASPYRVVKTQAGYTVEEPSDGLWRWRQIAAFQRREHLEAFLVAMLAPPRDHL